MSFFERRPTRSCGRTSSKTFDDLYLAASGSPLFAYLPEPIYQNLCEMGQFRGVVLTEVSTLGKLAFQFGDSQGGESMIHKNGIPCGKSWSHSVSGSEMRAVVGEV